MECGGKRSAMLLWNQREATLREISTFRFSEHL